MTARVGIRDVAQEAGVSIGTVSNYLNRPEIVAADRARRVEEAIQLLGFVPSSAGRQLRSGVSRVIVHMGTELGNPNAIETAQSVEQRATELGLSMFQVDNHGDAEREDRYLTVFEQYRVQGMLISSWRDIEERLDQMRRRGIPSVLVGQRAHRPDQPFVAIDYVEGGRRAVSHLLEVGCRRIAVVGGPHTLPQIADRLVGAREAIDRAGTAMLEIIDTPVRSLAEGYRVGRALLDREPDARPHGIFAINDIMALGILRAYHERGVRVPQDTALIGFDDIEYAAASLIPLTTLRGVPAGFGAEVVDLLFDVIQHKPVERLHRLVDPKLIVRESTTGFMRD
ncbi:LacI family DNA-binding transcriptional regulator [Microbacterium hominis]|uniref:LacI family DNA-binding transcriptional regulator n=1 Tax=Microbacterium hominis TaxID=162426 RepID=A0A7D4Q332_9MICO|nr:LacI family DNA-binding transcriptional regulator [Microbacterium hominis]QKJ20652.1 LacI family DNA-binding transcriptional regulator [Microbacterium hominis]